MSRTAKMGLAAALVVIVFLVLAWASVASLAGAGPGGAATAFFRTIRDKGAQAAYATTSPTFQRATPADAFVAAIQARGLADYRSSDWSVRSRQGDLAELDGAVNLKGGGAVPATMRLVKGASGWQVLSLELPQGGLTGASGLAAAAPAPAPAAGDAGADDFDSGVPASQPPPPPPNATPQPAPAGPVGLVAGAQPTAGAAPPAPAGAPDGTTYGAANTAGPNISRSRVARICGQTLMHNSWAESVRLHCPDPVGTAAGSTTRCLAVVNGRRTGLTATMDRYDPASDDAQLTCRLD